MDLAILGSSAVLIRTKKTPEMFALWVYINNTLILLPCPPEAEYVGKRLSSRQDKSLVEQFIGTWADSITALDLIGDGVLALLVWATGCSSGAGILRTWIYV